MALTPSVSWAIQFSAVPKIICKSCIIYSWSAARHTQEGFAYSNRRLTVPVVTKMQWWVSQSSMERCREIPRKKGGRDSLFPLCKEPAFTTEYLNSELELRGWHLFSQTNWKYYFLREFQLFFCLKSVHKIFVLTFWGQISPNLAWKWRGL